MRWKAAFALVGVTVGVVVVVANNGCSKDEESRRVSQKGEACQVTNDCAGGLACVPVPGGSGGGVCVTGQFRISETARECAIVQCQTANDCCATTQPAQCAQYLAQCTDAGAGSAACQQYDLYCKCNTDRIGCENNKCVSKCLNDTDCLTSGAGRKCGGGKCVQCLADGDCGSGLSCVSGTCQAPCQGDGDCAGFSRCVTGKCVESGCQTDRECVAYTRNVEATCGTDGKCIVPCQTDLECGNPKAYSFFSCIQNQCVYMGCQSDKDCRLLLSYDAGIGSKDHVVCRDKQTPGDTTRPAQ